MLLIGTATVLNTICKTILQTDTLKNIKKAEHLRVYVLHKDTLKKINKRRLSKRVPEKDLLLLY